MMKEQTQAILVIVTLESIFFGLAFLLVTALMIPVWTHIWTILYEPIYWAMVVAVWLMISFFGLKSFKWDSF